MNDVLGHYGALEVGMSVEAIATPQLVVDLDRVEANIARWHADVANHGVGLRSHVKTHKTLEVARMQLAAGSVGLAAAKPTEAEPFVADGAPDVVIAYPAVGVRARGIAALAGHDTRVIAHVESRRGLADLETACEDLDTELEVRIEIDTGFNRCGIAPNDAVEFGREVGRCRRLRLEGITTHRSAFFVGAEGRSTDELGEEEGRTMVEIAERMRTSGIAVPSVVGGSTPTSRPMARIDGVTEVCAGTYPFLDAGMASRGLCNPRDVAASVLCTVVSTRADGRVTVDGGSKTFARDAYGAPGPFGVSADGRGEIVALSEEHGGVQYEGEPPQVGDVVAIQPMHICVVVNLSEHVVAVRDGRVAALWPVIAAGKTR
jgi:D-serine deaminase-like pyridoxal phosphate-dependent protein